MPALQRILIATDFSDSARAAADRAARLARSTGAALTLLHALEAGEWLEALAGRWRGLDPARVRAAAGEALEGERSRLGADLDCATRLLDGPLPQSLPVLLAQTPADLLVMGARGASDWADALLGSTVDRVLRLQRLPVLIVRTAGAGTDYGRVAVATDFSPASEHAARFALALLPASNHLLLHVCESLFGPTLAFAGVEPALVEEYRRDGAREAMVELEAFSARVGGATQRAIPALREGRPSREIVRFVAEAGVDLMVVGAQGRSRVEVGLLGSVSRHLAADLPCDVLVVPPPAR